VNKPIIIVGAGGHAKVVADALLSCGCTVLGLTDPDPALQGLAVLGLPVLGDDGALAGYPPATIELVLGVGTVRVSPHRRRIFERFKMAGYSFATVVHPGAVIGREVTLGEGCQVMAGAIIQTGSQLGSNTLVNTSASIDHDCRIADHVQIGPGAVLGGGVEIGGDSCVGAGATVIQGIQVGSGVQVGAGAAVIRNCANGSRIVGVPGKES